MSNNIDLIIISGLSGSGKSVATKSLEDINYYCIDNLPVTLFAEYISRLPLRLTTDTPSKIAIGINSHNKTSLDLLDHVLQIANKKDIQCRIIFLESAEDKLIDRFRATKRRHPLTNEDITLIDAIANEKILLQPLCNKANKIIDTTEATPHELRGLIRDFTGSTPETSPLFLIESFGFKYGILVEADFIFDVRCLLNPYWQSDLKTLTGLNEKVKKFIERDKNTTKMTKEIFTFLSNWLPEFTRNERSYITVGIGCTGGQHRSVYVSKKLSQMFAEKNINVQLHHRELRNN